MFPVSISSSLIKIGFVFSLLCNPGFAFTQQSGYSYDFFELYAPNRYNSDNTLKLAYVYKDEYFTSLFFTYTCANTKNSFTNLYLNNLRIVDKSTGKTFDPVNTYNMPTTANRKLFFYNLGGPMNFRIDFPALPFTSKEIDVLEGTGKGRQTYSFTFKKVKFNDVNKVTESGVAAFTNYTSTPVFLKSFYTYSQTGIDIFIDDFYVGKLDQYFSPPYQPTCLEPGTLTICFPTQDPHRFYGTVKTATGTQSWNTQIKPGGPSNNYCHVDQLQLK